jgi:NADH dehydrogenase FAD-containing subunit
MIFLLSALVLLSAVIRVENDSGTSCSNIYLSNSESQIPSSLTVWTTGVKGYEIQ